MTFSGARLGLALVAGSVVPLFLAPAASGAFHVCTAPGTGHDDGCPEICGPGYMSCGEARNGISCYNPDNDEVCCSDGSTCPSSQSCSPFGGGCFGVFGDKKIGIVATGPTNYAISTQEGTTIQLPGQVTGGPNVPVLASGAPIVINSALGIPLSLLSLTTLIPLSPTSPASLSPTSPAPLPTTLSAPLSTHSTTKATTATEAQGSTASSEGPESSGVSSTPSNFSATAEPSSVTNAPATTLSSQASNSQAPASTSTTRSCASVEGPSVLGIFVIIASYCVTFLWG